MSKSLKTILAILILSMQLVFTKQVLAIDPVFSITPSSGYVKPGSNFTIDILIDSKGNEVTLARSVLTFDPTLLSVSKAERNESTFCSWPNNGQSVDNTNGVVMVTGFCQTGSTSKLYKTSGAADVFARITFKALREGNATIAWEYSGQDEPFKSVIMKNGSPTQNILNSKPSSVKFVLDKNAGGTVIITPPKTGLFDENPLLLGGIFLFCSMIVIFVGNKTYDRYSKGNYKKNGTVVIYDDK